MTCVQVTAAHGDGLRLLESLLALHSNTQAAHQLGSAENVLLVVSDYLSDHAAPDLQVLRPPNTPTSHRSPFCPVSM